MKTVFVFGDSNASRKAIPECMYSENKVCLEKHNNIYARDAKWLFKASLSSYKIEDTIVILIIGTNDYSSYEPASRILNYIEQLKTIASKYRVYAVLPFDNNRNRETNDGIHYTHNEYQKIQKELEDWYKNK